MWWLLFLHECLLYLEELSIILTDRYTGINHWFYSIYKWMWWLLYLHECLRYLKELSIILTDKETGINH